MSSKYDFIDTVDALKAFLYDLPKLEGLSPSLYIDLEGDDLGRTGTLSILTALVTATRKVYLIDVTVLGEASFSTSMKTAYGSTYSLKMILETPGIIKGIFDVRTDSDALYSLFDIRLAGVEDVQLMEVVTRPSIQSKYCVSSLLKCIEKDLWHILSNKEYSRWIAMKRNCRNAFQDKFSLFDQRPLLPLLADYSAQDVVYLPLLRKYYRKLMCDIWVREVQEETQQRIVYSQSERFENSPDFVFAPMRWDGFIAPSGKRMQFDLLRVSDPDLMAELEAKYSVGTFSTSTKVSQ